jgi:Na+-transporting NADH:ubiquinone oxidoreductase subunit F
MLVFTGLILLLTWGLMIASRKLVPSGPVRINVNDGLKDLTVPSGATLLSLLAEQKIFLPSACGGGGTCAMCKCVVKEGGGDILPTETGHINRRDARAGWRLACQLKVKRDLRIEVPTEVLEIRKFEGVVRSNRNVATFIKELIVDLPSGMDLNFKAGGYIQIDVPPYDISFRDFSVEALFRDAWDRFKLWDLRHRNTEPCYRAYSMANHPAEGNRVTLNVRIATPPPGVVAPPGVASTYIFNLKPGDPVVMSGPYGEFFPKPTDREMVYIGGGAGMAPLRSHIFDLLQTRKSTRKISFWYGARSRREIFYEDDFRALEKEFPNFRMIIALSEPEPADQWTGPVGFIHQVVLNHHLKNHADPQEIEYYLCGPGPMISAVDRMLDQLGVERDMIAYDDFG